MKGDYTEQTQLILNSMIKTIEREKEHGRHPHVRLQSFSPGTKLYDIRVESEQVSERLEMRPQEYSVFADLLKKNGIEIQR